MPNATGISRSSRGVRRRDGTHDDRADHGHLR
jgi:hypothetical protein